MHEYNDYISTTRRWLQYYNRFKAAIDCMSDDLSIIGQRLKDEDYSAPIARYGDMPAGGTSELNTVEQAVDRRIRLQQTAERIKSDVMELQRIVRKIDRALETLDLETKDIIRCRFIEGYSWEQVALRKHMSESGARKKGNRALSDIALVIFGIRAKPQQLSFVFLD